MAAPKKVDLRELMKKQRETKSSAKNIESPLAKYNSLGQLICKVCNSQVKSEILWTAHLQGKKHKENVEALKGGKQPMNVADLVKKKKAPAQSHHVSSSTSLPAAPPKSILKRKSDGYTLPVKTSGIPVKKSKVGEEDSHKNVKEAQSTESPSVKGLPNDFFDSSANKPIQDLKPKVQPTEEKTKKKKKKSSSKSDAGPSGLPTDFFDAGMNADATSSKEAENIDSTKKPNSAEALPEGFFDDPVMDAKIRKVEVKNTMEEEWSKFQKEMDQQQQVSENIAEEDDTAAQVTRNIDEIDEQIQRYATVEKLRDKQDEWKKKGDEDVNMEDENVPGSDEEAEFEEFLDWRSKGAWK